MKLSDQTYPTPLPMTASLASNRAALRWLGGSHPLGSVALLDAR